VTIEWYSSRTRALFSGVCAGRSFQKSRPAAATERTPTIATDTRQLVPSATIPASGTPITEAMVFRPITVDIAVPRSRYGTLSPTVAVTLGQITEDPIPANMRNRDEDREARCECREQREDAHDERAHDQEALSPEAIRVGAREHRDEDPRCAVRGDHETRGPGRDPELAGDLRQHGRDHDADVHGREGEEAEEPEESPALARAQARGRPANACRKRPNARM